MSVKPVDFQIMLPKTMEVAKMSNDEVHRNLTAQQQQVTATMHRAEDSLKQVYSRPQAQGTRIAEKPKENRKNDRKKKEAGGHSDKKDENGWNNTEKPIITSTIDIKV